jgi:hypothetical protein
MKFFLAFVLVFSIGLVTATPFGYDFLEHPVQSIINGSNYSINVNFSDNSDKLDGFHASYFYQASNPFGFYNSTTLPADNDTMYLFLNGTRSMTGNLNMGIKNVTNISNLCNSTGSCFTLTQLNASTPAPNLTPYWLSNGTSTATGDWYLGLFDLTATDITANGQVFINFINDDYNNFGGENSHILINNQDGTQNVITSMIGEAVKAKWRTDNEGNVNWVSYGNGVNNGHYFFVNGDYGDGGQIATHIFGDSHTEFYNNIEMPYLVELDLGIQENKIQVGSNLDIPGWMGRGQGFIFEQDYSEGSGSITRGGLVMSRDADNSILEFGVNTDQFQPADESSTNTAGLAGGLFRFDLRPAYGGYFAIITRPANISDNYYPLQIGLNTGNTIIGQGGFGDVVDDGVHKLQQTGTSIFGDLEFQDNFQNIEFDSNANIQQLNQYAGENSFYSSRFSNYIDLYTGTTLGTEKLTNGGFTGNANNWTLTSGWAYGTNNILKNANGLGTLTQTLGNMTTPIVAGDIYTLTYACSVFAGTYSVSAGGVTLGTGLGTGAKTFTFKATTNAPLTFTPTDTARILLDTISLKRITDGNLFVGGNVNANNITNYGETIFGNLNQTSGNFTGNNIYGGMSYSNDTATTITFPSSDVYYPLFAIAGLNNGFTFAGGFNKSSNLTAQVKGVYQVIYSASGDGINNHEYHMAVFINTTEQTKCESKKKMSSTGDITPMSGNCMLSLNVGDVVSLRIADKYSTGNGNYFNMNLNLVRIGN